jgi:predicted phage terminase large subunit-like protein
MSQTCLKNTIASLKKQLFLTTILQNKFIPHKPTLKQAEFLLLDTKEALYGGAAGGGKALYVGTTIPIHMQASTSIPQTNGWTTLEKIQVGDYIFDEQGQPTQVLATTETMHNHDCYKLTFSDGQEIIADAEHQWLTLTVKDREQIHRLSDKFRTQRKATRLKRGKGKRPDLTQLNQNRKYTYKPIPQGSLKTTKQIAETLTIRKRINHSISVSKPIELPKAELPIDPYVLGAWLGDGTSKASNITDGSKGVIQEIEKRGYHCRKLKPIYLWRIEEFTLPLLRKLNLYGNKHIPYNYLRSNVEQRLELLRGLMDTDGSANHCGHCEITIVNPQLMDSICELVNSLGIKTTIKIGKATINGRFISEKYRLKFVTELSVFSTQKKKEKQKLDDFRGTHNQRYIIKAEKVESVPVKCIQVASKNGMYLVGKHFIPTHNSDCLLMAALQYVSEKGYSAILFRRTFRDLSLPGALMDRSKEWLMNTDARWNGIESTWHFPSGAKLSFGYLDNENDKYRYQGAEFNFVGFDELTQFTEDQYRYLFSRLRRLETSFIPLRMRGASNPGGVGHDWVKRRFIIEGAEYNRVFIPARLSENPYLDQQGYIASLSELDPITRRQYLEGDWSARHGGSIFKREWFQIVGAAPNPVECSRVRYWDMAATKPKDTNKDPDYTVGALLSFKNGQYWISDIRRGRWSPPELESLIKQTAQLDGVSTRIFIEQEPGSEGIGLISHYQRNVLAGFAVYPNKATGSKAERAVPLSSASEAGNVKLIQATWNSALLDEFEAFPLGGHDDIVDACSGAFSQLTRSPSSISFLK